MDYVIEGAKIGLLIAIPLNIIRLVIYFAKGVDVNPFRIRRLFELLAISLGITFAFVKDEDFKK